ncbi:putative serine/threonine-protein kinase [Acorus calamus]|uniref:non-specific serine/threonine protein kinase n=1 Tax=Acorus calamus TaxID=4465 RepID=A0AAV9DPL9_ACOCL|nr:putative serine/threonine-protein kinase [Acorus calamus]
MDSTFPSSLILFSSVLLLSHLPLHFSMPYIMPYTDTQCCDYDETQPQPHGGVATGIDVLNVSQASGVFYLFHSSMDSHLAHISCLPVDPLSAEIVCSDEYVFHDQNRLNCCDGGDDDTIGNYSVNFLLDPYNIGYLHLELTLFFEDGHMSVDISGFNLNEWKYLKFFNSSRLVEYRNNVHAKCKKGSETKKIGIVVGSAVGGSLIVLAIVFFVCRRLRRRQRRTLPSNASSSDSVSSEDSFKWDTELCDPVHHEHLFTYRELQEATDNFSSSRVLGNGGFGTVYKGKLQDGRVVAVKRLYKNNYRRVEQFMNEVAILNRLRHPNLVSLFGCTSRHGRDLLLVYEYVPNGTLADHLHGPLSPKNALTWPIRMRVAIETAEALAYLHAADTPIVHRDVKTNNILLDGDFRVKVADFGLSRLFPVDATHVSTGPQGTPGYVDPEYRQCYQLTDKSDVYSFGVVLVELISSKPAVDLARERREINLSNMAVEKISNGSLGELVDPNLGFDSDWEVKRMVNAVGELVLRCLEGEREMRPSMEEVLEVLKGISILE